MNLTGRLAAVSRLLLCAVACAPFCCAGTLLSVTGTVNAGYTISKSFAAAEITFSTTSSYNNVLFSGVVDQGVASNGRAFLVSLANGVTVASGNFSVTASGVSTQLTNLLTVPSIYAGSYALEIFAAGSNFNWEGTAAPTIATTSGITILNGGMISLSPGIATSATNVAPAATFSVAFPHFQLQVTGTPEPGTVWLSTLGTATMLGLAAWRRKLHSLPSRV